MTRAKCTALQTQELTDYWLGELDEAHEQRVDEHLFACAACSSLGEQITTASSPGRASASSSESVQCAKPHWRANASVDSGTRPTTLSKRRPPSSRSASAWDSAMLP